jgi:putative resolvase
VTKQLNGYYIYDAEDVYKYVGKKRCNLNIIYARVSTSKQKADLTRQIETLESFCLSQGIKVDRFFFDIASGINERKTKTFFFPTRFSA